MSAGRVVVVGHGMVGSRFAADLAGRDPQAEVRVFGSEGYQPYNRVLLSDVVAGTTELTGLELPAGDAPNLRCESGTTVLRIDRARRVVRTSRHEVGYDVLVLATGARARVPDLEGLRGGLPVGAHALRSLDDAREIVAATANARSAVVLGGGVLGLEAASGLARRGLAVTLLHPGPGVMDRQLDAEAAGVVAIAMAALGVEVRTSATARRVLLDGHRVAGVEVGGADGDQIVPAQLLVLACGTEPETELAQQAGLRVERGVVVGADLASVDDPRVFAIGDCARPPEGGTGLIAQGWDQAKRLADALTRNGPAVGADRLSAAVRLSSEVVSRPSGGGPAASADVTGTDVVRAKVKGVDIVAMGVCGTRRVPDPRTRSVRLSDPAGGRHVEVVVTAGRLVGATCIGAPEIAADLAATYTRRLPVPADPAHLLMRPLPGRSAPASTPEAMPDKATVCTCNGVSKGEIVTCVHDGARSVGEIARATRATTGCGSCREAVCGVLDWVMSSQPSAAGREGSVTAGQPTSYGLETTRG